MIRISLIDFMDIIEKNGTARIRKTRQIKRRPPYDFPPTSTDRCGNKPSRHRQRTNAISFALDHWNGKNRKHPRAGNHASVHSRSN